MGWRDGRGGGGEGEPVTLFSSSSLIRVTERVPLSLAGSDFTAPCIVHPSTTSQRDTPSERAERHHSSSQVKIRTAASIPPLPPVLCSYASLLQLLIL